ncbi:hypothetical protein FSP39_000377, partial [Pinctada imbricata]
CEENHESKKISVEKGDFGFVTSYNYPDNYTSQLYQGYSCHVEIRGCSTCRLRLTLLDIQFPNCSSLRKMRHRNLCIPGCDHLQIHDVDQPYHTMSKRNYYGHDEGLTSVTISSNVRIRHCMSNASSSFGKRFQLKYEVIDKREEYKGTVASWDGNSGEITSPNFPNGYALNDETFTYVIKNLDPYGHVRVTFDDWHLASASSLQVYDGIHSTSPIGVFKKRERPVLVSEKSALILVFSTGKSHHRCCHPGGFKASYTFVSERRWDTKPNTNCTMLIDSRSGGVIRLQDTVSQLPGLYDCIWIIKRPARKNPDGLLLRLTEMALGEGWLTYEENSLEIISGITSKGRQLAKYTSTNLTLGQWFSPDEGLYIRLRGALSKEDNFKFIFTAVDNVTDAGCPKPGDYMCQNLWCIDRDLMCDGTDHCGDNSDESPQKLCFVSDIWKLGIKWNFQDYSTPDPCAGNFKCGGNSLFCLEMSRVCDRIPDCFDDSDEKYCGNYYF